MSLFTVRTAHFSPCRKWRYWLKIVWDESKPLLVVCGLNPSKADEEKDDQTLRRVQGFARDMGRGGVLMLNAFSWRSTDPKGLLACDDPVGPENKINNLAEWINNASPDRRCVAAWGGNIEAHKKLRFRLAQLDALHWDCFEWTKSGQPRHPLYLKSTCRPYPWNYPNTSLRELRGFAPDCTGDLTSVEFMEKLREEWDE